MAHELVKDREDIYVFEKNSGITTGENQSSRNSGVLHSGIYYEPEIRPFKGRLCIEGNRLWCEYARRYQLPCKQTGKLIVANDEVESRVLDKYHQQALLIPPHFCARSMPPPATGALFLCLKQKWLA